MVQLLLDYDAHPVKHDHEGLKPLHLYGMRECMAAMRAVLAPDGNVHPQLAHYSETPLHYAAHGNSKVVNLLVGVVWMPRGETRRIRHVSFGG
jgi:ankyrin repeat protein